MIVPEKASRSSYLDNAKGVLIVLVVIGHFLEPILHHSQPALSIYWLVYFFHMPLFAAISGYCSRADLTSIDRKRLISNLLIPYVILQGVYYLFDYWLLNNSWRFDLFTPYWILWYLLALFVWRIVLPYWMLLRWPLVMAVLVGLLAGLMPNVGYFLSLSRIMVLFPFFVAGAIFKHNDLKIEISHRKRLIALLCLLSLTGLITFLIDSEYSYRWLYASNSYGAMKVDWDEGLFVRSVQYALSAITCFAVMAFIPFRKTIFAWLGQYSLYPYFSHGLVAKAAIALGLYSLVPSGMSLAIIVLSAVILTFILTLRPVRFVVDCVTAGNGLYARLLLSAPNESSSGSTISSIFPHLFQRRRNQNVTCKAPKNDPLSLDTTLPASPSSSVPDSPMKH